MPRQAFFRFYEELNDFLPEEKKKQEFPYTFSGHPAVKDAVEANGVPHTEVDLILVNGESVPFSYQLQNADCVSVYPVFESFEISGVTRLRPRGLRETKFILDVHLGTLARLLRLLGFNTLYRNDYEDPEIVRIAAEEGRIVLTRDIGLLKRKEVKRGYWLRSQDPMEQASEVLRRFQLKQQCTPLSRCVRCNGVLSEVKKSDVEHLLETNTKKYFERFFQCASCGRIYWKGSHFSKIEKKIEKLLSFTNTHEIV